MVDGKRFVEVTETMKENLDDVSKSLREIQKYNEGLAKSFVGLTKTSTPFGRAWLALGRFTSGTGFWKFQNKVKALSDILQYQELLLKKRLEQEDELMAKLSNYDKHVKTLKKTEDSITKLQKGKLDFVNTESTFKSKYYKILKAEHGTTKALAILKERAVTAQKKAAVFEKEMDGPRIKSFKREGLRLKQIQKEYEEYEKREKSQSRFIKFTSKDKQKQKQLLEEIDKLGRSQFLTEENMSKLNDNQITSMLRLNDMVSERAALRRAELLEINQLEEDAQAAREAGEYMMFRSIEKEREERLDAINDIMQAKEDAIEEERILLEKQGILTKINYSKTKGGQLSADTSNIKDKGIKEKTLDYLKLSKAYKMWEKRHLIKEWGIKRIAIVKERGFRKLMGKGMRGVFKATTRFLFLSAQILLGMFLLVGFLILLKSSGFLDLIVKFVVGAVIFIGRIFELVFPVFEALGQFISDVINFFSKLLSGDMEGVWEALSKMGESFLELVKVAAVALWNIAYEAIDKLSSGRITKFKEWLQDKGVGAKGVLIATGAVIVGAMFVLFGMWLGASWLIAYATANPLIALIAALLGLLGASAMAEGGVSKGGMHLVGERGPELVNLPTGSRVHSNADSKRMTNGNTNNITVNVQGRVGATDSELRDIANKVSRMISTEINRTTSSSTRI